MLQRTELAGVRDATRPLWVGTSLARVLTYLYAVWIVWVNYSGYARPSLAVTIMVVMGLWTVLIVTNFLRRTMRKRWLVGVDLVLTCGLMLTSLLVLSPEQLTKGIPLITTVWAGIVPLFAGASGGWRFGVFAGLALSVCTGFSRQIVDQHVGTNALLMIAGGLIMGLAATAARTSTEALARALRTEAATAERERLASSIHDSVLQVLARVRRRGAELGGEAAELATLAGEQEVALRALVTSGPVEQSEDGEVDLRALLQPLATPCVHVSGPATATLLSSTVADDLAAAVGEALLNVDRHAGPGAQAWVLVEDLGSEVIVSVRDDGVGIPDGRLSEASAAGSLGVANSIRSKIRQLGGTATVETGPDQGTEWEMRVPRAPLVKKGRRLR